MIHREREADGTEVLVISDEGGEFARATTIDAALHYAGDLLYSDYASDGSDMIGLRRMREAARRHGIPL
jgi:hypothetical protein